MKKIKTLLLLTSGLLFSACSVNVISGSEATSSSNLTNSNGELNTLESQTESLDSSSLTQEQETTSSETSTDKNTTSENQSLSEQSSTSTSKETSTSTSSKQETSSSESFNSSSSSSSLSSSSSSSSQKEEDKPVVDQKITKYGTYGEAIFAEWQDNNAPANKVEYKLSQDSNYQELDKELIRVKDTSTVRFDALGLKAGKYDFKITTSSKEILELKNVEVTNYDRSGYAHFNYSNVGGYNDDGTVKNKAVIVYVDENTKNTVKANIGGKSYTGLSKILQAQSNSSDPLIIRIIGQVSAATWNEIKYKKGSSNLSASEIKDQNGKALPTKDLTEDEIIKNGYNTLDTSKYTKLDGLSNKISYSSGEFDSYYNMLDVSNAKNVTVEGVGDDAKIFQWGFTWKNCTSIEIRNLTFDSYTEDACSFEGSDDSTTLSGFKTGHIWIHNNQFNIGKNYWDVCPEQDKLEGDGATDFKKNAYITIAYNHYIKNHKTGLVGGGDSQHTACLTFHHNFYDQCSQRLPLGRQANMHMYNNYYYKTTSTSMSIRAGAYAFVEGCYFEGGNNPMETKTGDSKKGVIKSYNNVINGSKGTNNGTVVKSRDEKVANDNIYDKEFDTNSTNFYYDSVNKVSKVSYLSSAEQAINDVKAYAGPQHINPFSSSQVVVPPTPSTGEDPKPVEPTGDEDILNINDISTSGTISSNITKGIFTITANAEKTVEIAGTNNFTSFDSSYKKALKLSGTGSKDYRSIYFTISKKAMVHIFAESSNSATARSLAIYDSSYKAVNQFDPITSARELTYELSAGTYYIASTNSGMNVGAVVLEYIK